MKLTARKVDHLNDPGMYSDGNGLYLRVTKTGTKGWIHRYQMKGNRKDMGLGTLETISLKKAREKAADNRKLITKGIDPIAAREAEEEEKHKLSMPTFDDCAAQVISDRATGWKNPKSAQQWTNTLNQYASPTIGTMPVDNVDTELVMRVLEPIWGVKTETASRVRNRIEIILNWARVKGYRAGENPAQWRGHLEYLLPQRNKVQKPQHHSALPYREINTFMVKLNPKTSISAKALRLTILTACRTNEVIGAAWDEIDLEQKIWTIPGNRMKMEKPHTVPLSKQVVSLLESMPRQGDWLFPSHQYGKHIGNMAMLVLLKREMGYADHTVHGFRSTFRDWTAEETNAANIVAEMALAHAIGSGVEKHYRRGDLLAKRALLMQQWADYCDRSTSGSVVPFQRKESRHG